MVMVVTLQDNVIIKQKGVIRRKIIVQYFFENVIISFWAVAVSFLSQDDKDIHDKDGSFYDVSFRKVKA